MRFTNACLNVLLCIPFGFFLPTLWKKFRSAKSTFTAGYAESFRPCTGKRRHIQNYGSAVPDTGKNIPAQGVRTKQEFPVRRFGIICQIQKGRILLGDDAGKDAAKHNQQKNKDGQGKPVFFLEGVACGSSGRIPTRVKESCVMLWSPPTVH